MDVVSRREFEIAGFRNRDLREALHADTPSGPTIDADQIEERRREAGRISRQLAMLLANGLIKKIPRTHQYLVTVDGKVAISAILAARKASPRKLTAA